MKVINEFPPFYGKVIAAFPEVAKEKYVVFTCGNRIYNPAGGNLPPHLIVHESIHAGQQEVIGIDLWWDRFLSDPQFRLEQEIEAYQAEYRHFCKLYKDRNERSSFLRFQALMCSSPMYGAMISFPKAMERIKNDHVL